MAQVVPKLFVGHLPTDCKKSDIEELFGKYGTVKECDVLTNFGFVSMGSLEEAKAAIEALNNSEMNGAKIKVEESVRRPRTGYGRMRGGRGRRPFMRNGFDGQRGYQAAAWERYGGRMYPYPEMYAPIPQPRAFSNSEEESSALDRYSFDSVYNQYDPYGGPPSWSNFSISRPSPPLPRKTY